MHLFHLDLPPSLHIRVLGIVDHGPVPKIIAINNENNAKINQIENKKMISNLRQFANSHRSSHSISNSLPHAFSYHTLSSRAVMKFD